MKFALIAVLMLINGSLFAWNSTGHRLIAQIAIDQLPKGYVKKLSRLNHEMDAVYPPRNLVNASTWMDNIRWDLNQWYTDYHYDETYFSEDGTPLPTACGKYAGWAIETAANALQSNKTTRFNKAMSLRILLHVIGDIHQPLHSISRVSKDHPDGDLGGNAYDIVHNSAGKNLHEFWDNGGGYLKRSHPVRYQHIVKMARRIEHTYPCKNLPVGKVDSKRWLQESREKALKKVYGPLQGGNTISQTYQREAKTFSQYQIALAGCRLAKQLNKLKIAY